MMSLRINSLTLITIIFATASKNAIAHNVSSQDAATRIIGGAKALVGQFPYFAGLVIVPKEGKDVGSGICGGSLIALTSILTAAHCVNEAKLITIVLGVTNLIGHEATEQLFHSNEYILHPGYRKDQMQHDIAIVKLNETVRLGKHVKIIPTAPANSHDFTGSTSTMIGFGLTSDTESGPHWNTLKFEMSYIISNAECRKQGLFDFHLIRKTHICQSTRGGITTPCDGDSGGPLVVHGVQVGIFTFTADMCKRGLRSVYERTSSYYQWIKDNSKINK